MLEHVDSPFIRCVGFLYLRYAADPSTLWSWFEPYLHDDEAVQVRQGKAETTVGEYVRSLLNELDYYGTRLPRLPIAVERQIKVRLLQAERVEERARLHLQNSAAMEYFQRVGSRVQALYGDEDNPVTWYDAVVDKVILRNDESGDMLERPKFRVTFPEYGNTEVVTLGEVDLPGNNAGGSDVGGKPSASGVGSNYDRGGYDRGGYGDDRDRGRGYGDDRDRGRGYDNRGYHDDRRGRHGRDDYRGSERPRDDRRYRERSRSRDRDNGSGRRLNDARREERELMEEVIRRERDKTAAKGRAYASRPTSFKDSLGSGHGSQGRHDQGGGGDWRPPHRDDKGGGAQAKSYGKEGSKSAASPAATPAVQKTAAELAAIEEKKRKLRAKYG